MLRLLLLGSLALLASCRVFEPSLNLHSHLRGVPKFVPKSAPINTLRTCHLDKLKKGAEIFNEEIEYTGDPGDYKAFISLVDSNFLRKGGNGFFKLCHAFNDGITHYGADALDCVTTRAFETMFGTDMVNARNFAVFYHELGMACFIERVDIYRNYGCITKTFAASKQHNIECEKKYEDENHKDPGNFCKYGQEYLFCLADPYKVCGQDVRDSLCNVINAGLSVVFPCRDFTCKEASTFNFASMYNEIPKSPILAAAKCDLNKMKTCGTSFFKETGYSGDPANFFTFSSYVYSKFYGKGQKGFDEFCGDIDDFEKCYGPGLIDCLSIDNIKALGADQKNADNYAVFFHQQGYMCGAGKKAFDDKWNCYINTTMAQQKPLEKCLDTFLAAIKKDPDNLCKYVQEYTNCYIKPFGVCGADLQNSLCGMLAAGFTPVGCQTKCKGRSLL